MHPLHRLIHVHACAPHTASCLFVHTLGPLCPRPARSFPVFARNQPGRIWGETVTMTGDSAAPLPASRTSPLFQTSALVAQQCVFAVGEAGGNMENSGPCGNTQKPSDTLHTLPTFHVQVLSTKMMAKHCCTPPCFILGHCHWCLNQPEFVCVYLRLVHTAIAQFLAPKQGIMK